MTAFHLADPSPWPFLTAISVVQLPLTLLSYMNTGSSVRLTISFIFFMFILKMWADDVVAEGTFQGFHTELVQKGLIIGCILFIGTEIILFLSFFSSYFYYLAEGSIWVGGSIFVPGLALVNPLSIPLLNSILLLMSSVLITFAHAEISAIDSLVKQGNLRFSVVLIFFTILLGVFFLIGQLWEYNTAQFAIQDSIYGSVFYLITGFHGFHVLVGVAFLTLTFFRARKYHFTVEHHVGFEFSALYWHFVDAVWFFVYTYLYIYPWVC